MLTGSMVAVVTPMTDEGKVDFASLERLVEFHIDQGTDAIVAVGTTGESATLSLKEQLEVVSQTLQFASGRIPVIAGNGRNSTTDAIEVTQALSKLGVDAMLGVTPYYNKPTQKGLIQHYLAVAYSTDIPQILYNVPGRTGVDLLPETVAELSQFSTIIGVKEATGDLTRVATLRQLCGQNFKLYSGDDATACEFLLRGGDGVISVTNNVAAKQFKQMCDAALAGNTELAYSLDKPMHRLYKELFCQSNPIPVKWAVEQMGLIETGTLRLPLTPLETNYHQVVRAAMKDAHIEVQ